MACGIEICFGPCVEGKAYCADHVGLGVFTRCEHCGVAMSDGDQVVSSEFLGLSMAVYHPTCWDGEIANA